MSYTNSPLVDCKVMSPNHSGTRTHDIDVIIPHCVVGQLIAKNIGYCFDDPSTQNSCNYGIGTEGDVCLVVDEANRSWCTSSRWIDQRGITIECASDKTEPYAMNDKVYNKLIDLCVDICKRNGKKKLLWFADKDKTIDYLENKIAKDEMVFAVHRWFANKSCPGDWLYSRLGKVAEEVTKRLGGTASAPTSPIAPTGKFYRIRKSWADASSQLGAFTNFENAKKACKDGYIVFDWNGNAVYPIKNVEPPKAEVKISVLEWQKSAIADGFEFPKYGADGIWGAECEAVAKNAIVKKRLTYKYTNLTKLVQRAVGLVGNEIDGKAGATTEKYIVKYQMENCLEPDGVVGINTWRVILGV